MAATFISAWPRVIAYMLAPAVVLDAVVNSIAYCVIRQTISAIACAMRNQRAIKEAILIATPVIGSAVIDCNARRARQRVTMIASAIDGRWSSIEAVVLTASIVDLTIVICAVFAIISQ